MRCNFVACFVLGLATVVYTAPVASRRDAGPAPLAGLTSPPNQGGLASMASLETRNAAVVVFKFPATEPVAGASVSTFHLPYMDSKPAKVIKDKAAEESAQSTVERFLQVFGFEGHLEPGSIFGGTSEEAKGRIDFLASNVPGFENAGGWATSEGDGELQGTEGGKIKNASVKNWHKTS
ncbi:hypothetical protein C8J55DRAFT_37522 [Lentinula edodes]|uniref:Uncharacterized protein n=1 Tax=Lentinula lateritia TaxID=40482 RepID=A0A9W9AJF1_9AGAR|nr:hypothetical protein C8J55DRAFT_37522 [Lentinula edodes]